MSSSSVLLPSTIGRASLTVIAGKASKREVALALPAIIGRGAKATLIVAHKTVSREHCEVFEEDGVLLVRDLDSLNGTYVGNARVGEAELRPGDELTVGPLTFRVDYQRSRAPPAEVDSDLDFLLGNRSGASGASAPDAGAPDFGAPAVDPSSKSPSGKSKDDSLDVQPVEHPPEEPQKEPKVDDMIDFVLGLGLGEDDDDSRGGLEE